MKKIYSACAVLLLAVLGHSADFYEINSINDIFVYFKQDDWDARLDQLWAQRQEERLLGRVVINGEEYDSVGVRYKGNSSYSANRVKNPLNIKLDYLKDQKHDGYGTIKLSNGFKDPSFIRETLSYEIARQYLPSSRANYARVYVNDQYLGLYVSVQDVDKSFVNEHYGSKKNAFFKGELVNDSPRNSVVTWGYLGADSSSYMSFYERESDAGWGELINFLDVFNNDPANMESVLNVDRHLWMLAFDILFVNLDAPINFAHNYYLYQDDDGRFNPIIWDLNENFGGFSQLLGGGGPGMPLNLPTLDLFLNAGNPNYPIVNKIFSNVRYKKRYVAHLKTIFQEIVENGWYLSRANELQALISAQVEADGNKFYSMNDFWSNLHTTVRGSGAPGPGNQPIIGLKELMDNRADYLNRQPEFTAEPPLYVNKPQGRVLETSAVFSVQVENADLVELYVRDYGSHAFGSIEMLDDGQHQDGTAGDGVYGAVIENAAPSLQFYCLAENAEAASFSPARAAYEFYTLASSGDLVINELMADNESTAADANGEFDDWIELYNAGATDLHLGGYFLSDDADKLAKWICPDTTIPANGYLIIWADKDADQPGLHADFKLSADGEAIYLCDADTQLVDQIHFGPQSPEESFGRFPNGTGSFMSLPPTFAEENVDTISSTDKTQERPLSFQLLQNYPNPFNGQTTIAFTLPSADRVTLRIFDVRGREVATLADGLMDSGRHQATWNSAGAASGVYFYQIQSGEFQAVRKMSLVQ